MLSAMKNKIAFMESEISQIGKITGAKPLSEAVKDLNLLLKEASGRLPVSENEVIRDLSENARKLKIEVENISFLNKQDLSINIPGSALKELSISLKLVCTYQDLGRYLLALRDNFPILISLKQVNIHGNGQGQANLNVELIVSAYLQENLTNK
jgi:Tfp pilus assembly protein PilO